jgi:type VI secretion system secreted protein VgrG
MTVGFTQANTYLSMSSPFGADTLLLRAARGEERLSTPFQFWLDMLSEQSDLDFSQIVGKGVTISVTATGGTTRYIHGIMTRFVQAGTSDRFTAYFGELRPTLWLLGLCSDHRIYQQKSVLDIVKDVFSRLGVTDVRDATTQTYTARDYCVQYGESALNFVARLLAEEGIHYYFEHVSGKHTLVLADDSDAHTALTAPTAIRYTTAGRDHEADDVILACTMEQQVVSNQYVLDDYEFTTSTTELAVTGTEGDGALSLYEYPGNYSVKDRGEALAKLRLEALETDAKVLRGDSTVRTFVTGYTFTVAGHPRSDVNASYLLRAVSHSATADEYRNRFEAIPATVPFRPAPAAAKPRIPGAQTAIVVGKSGEEIWTDQYGRVKVQFHWDQLGANDETSSCWIRVAQGWTGQGWGALFTPRIGQEVVVTFLNGDPDRPLITGMVYNGQQTVPYALPDEQTKSTIKTMSSKSGTAGNEIRFEDKKDSEELYLHAQKDMTTLVEHDRATTVTNNDTLTVTQARAVTVSEGDESLTVTKGKRTVAVTAGDETHTVGGKRSVTSTGDESHTSSAKFTHGVTGDYALTINGNLTIDVKGSVSIKSGTTFANESGTTFSNKAGTDLTNEATSGLTNKGVQVTNQASAALTNKGVSITNDASGELNNKAGGMQNVEASGILVLKGSLVKIN